jgi:hypothetical protein
VCHSEPSRLQILSHSNDGSSWITTFLVATRFRGVASPSNAQPRHFVVGATKRCSATEIEGARAKWGFMKDSKGMFDTYQLSLRISNFDNLKGVEV